MTAITGELVGTPNRVRSRKGIDLNATQNAFYSGKMRFDRDGRQYTWALRPTESMGLVSKASLLLVPAALMMEFATGGSKLSTLVALTLSLALTAATRRFILPRIKIRGLQDVNALSYNRELDYGSRAAKAAKHGIKTAAATWVVGAIALYAALPGVQSFQAERARRAAAEDAATPRVGENAINKRLPECDNAGAGQEILIRDAVSQQKLKVVCAPR